MSLERRNPKSPRLPVLDRILIEIGNPDIKKDIICAGGIRIPDELAWEAERFHIYLATREFVGDFYELDGHLSDVDTLLSFAGITKKERLPASRYPTFLDLDPNNLRVSTLLFTDLAGRETTTINYYVPEEDLLKEVGEEAWDSKKTEFDPIPRAIALMLYPHVILAKGALIQAQQQREEKKAYYRWNRLSRGYITGKQLEKARRGENPFPSNTTTFAQRLRSLLKF